MSVPEYRQAVVGDFQAHKYGACASSGLVQHLAAVYGFFTVVLLAHSRSHGPVSTCDMHQLFQGTFMHMDAKWQQEPKHGIGARGGDGMPWAVQE
jgi:hypothetical protein